MEIRKVQVTGGASFIVSLPKKWAKKYGIKKNDKIGIIERKDGSLTVIPKVSGEHKEKIKEFNVEDIKNTDYIFRLLIGAYMVGYNIVVVKSKRGISPFVRETVRNFIKAAIGLEIMEETRDMILIKDFLNPSELPFDKATKRIFSIVKSMHEDIVFAIRSKDEEIFKDIVVRDDDVDRLNWLVARQYHSISNDFSAEEKIADYSLIGRIMERIGDHAVRIAKNAIKILPYLDNELAELIAKADSLAIAIFNKSMQSFLRKDLEMANDSIEEIKNTIKFCKKLGDMAIKRKGDIAISLGYIIESIRRTAEYSGDFAEYVINYLIK